MRTFELDLMFFEGDTWQSNKGKQEFVLRGSFQSLWHDMFNQFPYSIFFYVRNAYWS